MKYLYILVPVILCSILTAMQLHMIRRPDRFGVNAGYYLSGDGVWAGQMQPAAASADGDTGLVPMPKAGQNDSYLRGDGKWIRASNAPTIAQYAYSKQTAISANYTTGDFYKFELPAQISGTSIVQLSATQFQLQPNQTYKCTADLNCANGSIYYQWYNVTRSAVYGTSGSRNGDTASTALGYITPTVSTIIGLSIVRNGAAVYGSLVDIYGRGAWATIEAVSNNNTIAAFTGASASADGFVGYIPTPKAGQQNHVLTGDGKWTKLGLGITGEAWNDVTDQRKFDYISYTNARTYPISLSIYCTLVGSGNGTAILYIDNRYVAYVRNNNISAVVPTITGIVPAGKTYHIKTEGTAVLNYWGELY